jgi:high-affinity iron transporter
MNFSVATQAALVLLREGAEALLVIAALAAYLHKAGEPRRLRSLLRGAGLAVLASLLTAWVFERYFGGEHDDRIEGGIMLLAAAVLFYVSGWLFVRQDPRLWQAYLRQHVDAAMQQNGSLALAAVAFLAVYREGAETVLFLHALAVANGGWSAALLLGLAGGAAGLVLGFFLVRVLALRLPLRPLFAATSALLFVMGLNFVGAALQEFQELGWVPYDDMPGAGWLETLGANASAEVLGTQLAICLGALVTALVLRRRRAAPASAAAAATAGGSAKDQPSGVVEAL